MKKILIILSVVIIIAAAFACRGTSGDDSGKVQSTEQNTETTFDKNSPDGSSTGGDDNHSDGWFDMDL